MYYKLFIAPVHVYSHFAFFRLIHLSFNCNLISFPSHFIHLIYVYVLSQQTITHTHTHTHTHSLSIVQLIILI